MRTAVCLAFLLWAAPALAQWVPPAAIPAPTFGIDTVVAPTTLWVDQSTGLDTNPGTQAAPKRTIPRTLAAGTSVHITGIQTQNYESPNTLLCNGTPTQPVFITGGIFASNGEITGTYCILEPLGPGNWVVRDRATLPSHHISIRHSRGIARFAVASFAGFQVTDIVLYDDQGCGTYTGSQSEAQGDNHGVTIGRNTGSVWVVDSNFSRCSGDGVQVNGSPGGALLTGPTYIGRNIFDHNRQSGVGLKESHDTVVSENVISNMRPDIDFTNPGACTVLQYFPIRAYYFANQCSSSENGFLVGPYDDPGAMATLNTSPVFFGGNSVSDIHTTRTVFNPNDPWSYGWAFRFIGGSARVLKDNHGTNLDGAVSVIYPQTDGQPYIDQGGNVFVLAAVPATPANVRVAPPLH